MTDSGTTLQCSPSERTCRYCGRPFKAKCGLTSHLNSSHPEHFTSAVVCMPEYPLEADGTILIENLNWVWP